MSSPLDVLPTVVCTGLLRMALASTSQIAIGAGELAQSTTIYFPLEPNQTRFLTIFPASRMSDAILSELIVVSLDDEAIASYEALSYTWESQFFTHSILVNNCQFKITANLFDAIRYLRDNEKTRTLWIDAVCINQRDLTERSRQVLYMGKIFSTVRQVVIWLGKDEYSGVPDLHHSPRGLRKFRTSQERAVALRLFERNWWHRSWTVQEFLHARELVFVCGSVILSWAEIWTILDGLQAYKDGKYCHIYNFARSKNSHKNDRLQAVMIDFGHCQATDPRDKVFAYLGIAKDGRMMVPDYTASVQKVYIDVVKFYLKEDQNMDIICAHHRGYNTISLPSWVPDWSIGRTSTQSWTVDSNGQSPYHAASTSRRIRSSGIYVSSESEDFPTLEVSGVCVGLISEMADSIDPKLFETDDWVRKIRSWLPENITSRQYLNGETNFRAFFRTIMVDAMGLVRPSFRPDSPWDELVDRFRAHFSDPAHHFPSSTTSVAVQRGTYRKRFAKLSSGHMAMVPNASEKGDFICILSGCNTPMGLRRECPSPSSSANIRPGVDAVYRMIGPCYVHGVMDGEMAEKIGARFTII
jgi:hypothetical protein